MKVQRWCLTPYSEWKIYIILNIGLTRYEQRESTQKIIDSKGGNGNKDEYFK